jgi:hypothetical protein
MEKSQQPSISRIYAKREEGCGQPGCPGEVVDQQMRSGISNKRSVRPWLLIEEGAKSKTEHRHRESLALILSGSIGPVLSKMDLESEPVA